MPGVRGMWVTNKIGTRSLAGVQSHVEEEEEGERPKGKLSRKARLAAKKAARLARKQAGSDDEDAAATDGGETLSE